MLTLPALYGHIEVDTQSWPIHFTVSSESLEFRFSLDQIRYAWLISHISFLPVYKDFEFHATGQIRLVITQLPDLLMVQISDHISGNRATIYISSTQLATLVKSVGLGFDSYGNTLQLGDRVATPNGDTGTIKGFQFFEPANEFNPLRLLIPELSNQPVDPRLIRKVG
jgi:hypothetical protein